MLVIAILTVSFSSQQSYADRSISKRKACGPTINLDYGQDRLEPNPVSTFAYFVPLVAHTPIENWMSNGNSQIAEFTSYKRKSNSSSFTVKCQFEMSGKGTFKNIFNPAEMLKHNLTLADRVDKDGTVKHLVDYILFEGDALGCIEIKGKIKNNVDIVEEISISFKDKSKKSPVLLKMYDTKPVNGKNIVENRKNEYIARVNKLSFKRSGDKPCMTIELASIRSAKNKESIFSSLGGMVLNMFLPPMPITELGNDSMLSFGEALTNKQSAYVFPSADKFDVQVAMAARSRK